MVGLKSMVQRLCLVAAAVLVSLAVTGTSVAAQGGAGMIQNTNSPQYQQEAADLRASQYYFYGYPFGYGYDYGYGFGGNPYYGYYGGTPFYYNGSPTGQNPFTLVGCDTGNYSCLNAKGGNVYGNGYGYGYPGYGYGYPSYGGYANPGFTYGYGYGYAQAPSGPPLYGYALNYNFNFPYSGIPDSYFKTATCAVGDYTCLFGKLGNGMNLPDSFFAAVGCPTGNYACATSQTVFTNVGCTIGNYACVYGKTGKMPTA